MHTGKWVREAAGSHESLIVLDRGRPVARLLPLEDVKRIPFSERTEVVGFDQLPETGIDSGRLLEEDRR